MRSSHSIFSVYSKLYVWSMYTQHAPQHQAVGSKANTHTHSPNRHHANGMISMKILFNLLLAIVNIGVLAASSQFYSAEINSKIDWCVCVCVYVFASRRRREFAFIICIIYSA